MAVVAPLPELGARGRERVERAREHARRALHASAELSGCAERRFEKSADDVPRPSGGWHWSVSHSHAHVAACVHRAPVGIDVEERRAIRPELIEHALNAHELARLELLGDQGFLRAWTAKEALLKELGLGLAGLSRCGVREVRGADLLLVEFETQRRLVRQLVEGQRVVSVSSADDAEVTWITLGAPLGVDEGERA